MKIVKQVLDLSPEQIKLIHAALIDAAIAYEAGTQWKHIFSKLRSQHPAGRMGKVCSYLIKLTGPDMQRVSAAMAKDNGDT